MTGTVKISLITFKFKPTCKCPDNVDPVALTIEDLQEPGWPICAECGEDFEVMPLATID